MLLSTLPEGFIADNNTPIADAESKEPIQTVDDKGMQVELLPTLPAGFTANSNLPVDNEVKPVKEIMVQAVDPVAKAPEVTPLDYINSRKEAQAQPKPTGFVDKTLEDFKQSVSEGKITLRQSAQDQITGAETALRLGGDVANFIGDVVGNTVSVALGTAGDVLSFVVPDSIEKPVVDAAKEGISFVANTEAGQAGIDALMSGVSEWEAWAKANPRAAENIRSVVDIGLVLGPIKGVKAQPFSPVVSTQSKLKTYADNLAKQGAKDALQAKRQKLVNSFLDLATDTDALKRRRDSTFNLTPMQETAADAVATVPKYSPLRTASGNLNAVGKQIDIEDELMAQAVKGVGDVNLPKFYDELTQNIDTAIKNSIDPKATDAAYATVLDKVENAIRVNRGKDAEGMLKARLDLDKWLLEKQGDTAFNKKGPVVQAVKEARNAMNASIAEVSPAFAAGLKRNSGLRHAQEGLATKAAREGSETIMPLVRNTMRLIGAQRNVGFALAGLGIGSYATLGTPIALIAAGVGGVYLTSKAGIYGFSKVVTKKNGAIILNAVDSAMKQAQKMGKEGVPVIRQLRLQRAGFVDYLRDMNEIWENEGGKEKSAEEQRKAVQTIKALPVNVPQPVQRVQQTPAPVNQASAAPPLALMANPQSMLQAIGTMTTPKVDMEVQYPG
tara:strand:- start:46 stop:2055 length:2010 start_codon:yes stop_codon:yes gene_type:complete